MARKGIFIGVRVPKDLAERLDRLAKRNRLTRSEQARQIIAEKLDEKEADKKELQNV